MLSNFLNYVVATDCYCRTKRTFRAGDKSE